MENRPVAGLQTTIWNNNVKSVALLVLYPFILAGVAYAVFYVIGYFGANGMASPAYHSAAPAQIAASYAGGAIVRFWPIILTVTVIWFLISYFFQGAMVRSLSHSHSVARTEEPQLYNLVENLCIANGMKMPALHIIETRARNAFASGINDSTYAVTVTRGLLQSLSKDELEAVLAHELTHIINRDVRLMMVCVVFTGMLGVSAQILWSNMRYSLWIPSDRRRNQGGGFIVLFFILIVLWVGYAATLLTRLALSRRREYMADAGAVKMTKNPDAMMRALIRIAGMADIPKAPDDIRAMCFENVHGFMGLFATHPPIEDRIRTIAAYSNLPVPPLPQRRRAEDGEAFLRPGMPGTRENWTTRERFPHRRNRNPWAQ